MQYTDVTCSDTARYRSALPNQRRIQVTTCKLMLTRKRQNCNATTKINDRQNHKNHICLSSCGYRRCRGKTNAGEEMKNPLKRVGCVELLTGFEPVTSSLPRYNPKQKGHCPPQYTPYKSPKHHNILCFFSPLISLAVSPFPDLTAKYSQSRFHVVFLCFSRLSNCLFLPRSYEVL